MKRTQMSKNINSGLNKNPFNYINRNIIFPNAIGPFPLTINEMAPTVEIIEINSDESGKRCNNNSCNQVNSDQESSDTSRKSGENRLKNIKDYTYDIKNKNESSTDDDSNETFNSHCHGDYNRGEGIIYNEIKHVTVKNNNIISNTSSEADGCDDIQIIHFNDTVCDDILWNSNSYTIMDFNDNSSKPSDWIYSFKNNKYSYENDYDLSKTNSNNSSSCSTVTDDEEVMKYRSTSATSIFNWIPKLNLLSSPLPTVTELTEPNKQSSSDITEVSSNHRFIKKSTNGWLEDNFHQTQNRLEQKENASSKLSTLSQRERRRNKVAKILNREIDDNEQGTVYSGPYINSTQRVGNIANSLKDISNVTAPSVNENGVDNKIDTFAFTNRSSSSRKEQIKSSTQSKESTISDQVEKLEGNWLDPTNNDDLIDVYDYDLDTVDGSCGQSISKEGNGSNFITDIVPKLTDSSQYEAATNNVPILHLSLETDFDEDKKSCLKCFYNFINCCK